MGSIDDIQSNKKKSASVLKLESLEKEFNLVLSQYQETYQNYLSSLQEGSSSYVQLQNNTYWGSNGRNEGSSNTADACQAMCSADTNCTGATYNESSSYCWTRGGDGPITSGSTDQYAIVPKMVMYKSILQFLNSMLIDLNQEIQQTTISVSTEVNRTTHTLYKTHSNLVDTYKKLLEEKNKINNLIVDFETLNESDMDAQLVLTHNHIQYTVLFIIALIVMIVTFYFIFIAPNKQSGGGSGSGYRSFSNTNIFKMLFIFFLMFSLLVFAFIFKHNAGYFIFFILVVVITLIKMKIIPNVIL